MTTILEILCVLKKKSFYNSASIPNHPTPVHTHTWTTPTHTQQFWALIKKLGQGITYVITGFRTIAYYQCYNTVWSDNLICGKCIYGLSFQQGVEEVWKPCLVTPQGRKERRCGLERKDAVDARCEVWLVFTITTNITTHPRFPPPHLSCNSCIMTDVCASCALLCTKWGGGSTVSVPVLRRGGGF